MSTFRTLGIEEISHRISGADALIVCHTSPDGDTVGSAFALAEIIRLTGGDARVVCSENFPDRFSFMTRGESGEYRDGDEDGKTLICVDVASPAQLGRLTHLAAKADIMIDHHGTGEIFSDGLSIRMPPPQVSLYTIYINSCGKAVPFPKRIHRADAVRGDIV